MKKNIYLLVGLVLFMITAVGYSLNIPYGKTLSISRVKSKWGSDKFDVEQFKESNQNVKAKMAYSLLKQEDKWIGKDVDEVRKLLGSPDGYYFVDIHPAYIIQEGKNSKEETWQIVFLLDNNFKVKKLFVHKNCCDN